MAGSCEETRGEEAEDGGRVLRGPGWWKPDAGLFSESWRQQWQPTKFLEGRNNVLTPKRGNQFRIEINKGIKM